MLKLSQKQGGDIMIGSLDVMVFTNLSSALMLMHVVAVMNMDAVSAHDLACGCQTTTNIKNIKSRNLTAILKLNQNLSYAPKP